MIWPYIRPPCKTALPYGAPRWPLLGRHVGRPYRISRAMMVFRIENRALACDGRCCLGRGGIHGMIDGMIRKDYRGYFHKMRIFIYFTYFRKKERRVQQVSIGGMLGLGIGFNDGFDAGKNIQGRDCPAETAGKIFLIIGALGDIHDLLDGIFQIDPPVSVGIFGTELRKTRKKEPDNENYA